MCECVHTVARVQRHRYTQAVSLGTITRVQHHTHPQAVSLGTISRVQHHTHPQAVSLGTIAPGSLGPFKKKCLILAVLETDGLTQVSACGWVRACLWVGAYVCAWTVCVCLWVGGCVRAWTVCAYVCVCARTLLALCQLVYICGRNFCVDLPFLSLLFPHLPRQITCLNTRPVSHQTSALPPPPPQSIPPTSTPI